MPEGAAQRDRRRHFAKDSYKRTEEKTWLEAERGRQNPIKDMDGAIPCSPERGLALLKLFTSLDCSLILWRI